MLGGVELLQGLEAAWGDACSISSRLNDSGGHFLALACEGGGVREADPAASHPGWELTPGLMRSGVGEWKERGSPRT